ncbi:C13 family peptidase [Marinicellulosiphila megalodicopiae]|uniref:C13 family peptidase n=1 Tax=Marinicellulosiphila megalodicopiae TaxID=2724896 RepID=UPI003BB0D509
MRKFGLAIVCLIWPLFLIANEIITLPDGSIYEGQIQDGLLSGEGRLIYTDQTYYEGEFKQGVFEGYGKLTKQNDFIYEGDFSNGQYNGQGKYYNEQVSYEGHFENNVFTGKGIHIDYDGIIYSGTFTKWTLNDQGSMQDKSGNKWTGIFKNNEIQKGEYIGIDGTHYIGDFSYARFNGLGTLTYPNGDQYIGQFSWGSPSGKGQLTKSLEDGTKEILKGIWQEGEFKGDPTSNEYLKSNRDREQYLYNQTELLNAQFDSLTQHDTQQIDYYSLTAAMYGGQSVFASEVSIINQTLNQYKIQDNQQITLMNSMDNLDIPWATHHAIKLSLEQIQNKIDVTQDVLLMYLTSHGNADIGIALDIHGMNIGNISPTMLSDSLNSTKIKWRVIIISACYSGVFIDKLKNKNSIIITAADSTHTSFGCSNDLDMTYFGQAYFQDAFKSLDFIDTFNRAKLLVKEREEAQGYEFSNPQIFVGDNIRAHLNLTTEIKDIKEKETILNQLKKLFLDIKDKNTTSDNSQNTK